jgi:glycosyltransferase involved in cell wall biosynthesis
MTDALSHPVEKIRMARQEKGKRLVIAYVLPGVGIGGGNNIIFEHASRLADRGHHVFLLNMLYTHTDINWHPKRNLRVFNLDDKLTYRYLANIEIDILFATGWQTFYEILRRDLRARHFFYFVQAREALFNPRGSWDARLADITLNAKLHYVTEASWIQKWLSAEFGHEVLKLPHKLNREIISKTDPLSPRGERVRVLLEGPLSNPWKRMNDSFLAVQNLDAEIWCVSGAGELQPWQRPDRFFFAVPYAMMSEIMSSCDILVKLSAVEGVFGPPLEMMACGGTAVTSRVNGYDEYIVDGYNALTVDIGDYENARRKLRALIDDRELLQLLKSGARETADRLSDWESTIDILESKIQCVCAVPCEVRSLPMATMAGSLSTMFDLCLDVMFSRYDDVPIEKRANWQTTASCFGGVTYEKTDDVYWVSARGWAFDSSNGRTYKSFALQVAGSLVKPDNVSIEAREDIARVYQRQEVVNSGYSFVMVAGPTAAKDQLAGALQPADARSHGTILVEISNGDWRPVQAPPEEPKTRVGNGPIGCLEALKVLPGWRINLAVAVDRWPVEHGDNYCPILQVRSNPQSVNYVLHLPDEPGDRTWFPAVNALEDGSTVVEIDLFPIYRGRPSLDFILFIDPEAKILDITYRPGLLGVHNYIPI